MGDDDDFDVEDWNRRFLESPTEAPDRPRLRTRDLEPVDDLFDDPFDDASTGTEVVAEEGFPSFEHNQWTVEGEIERFGAFGRGVSSSRGWRRGVGFVLLALLVAPLVLQAAQIVSRLFS